MRTRHIIAAALLLAVAAAPAFAARQAVAQDGRVYRVQVEKWQDGVGSGSALWLDVHAADGRLVESTVVPGTDDSAIDREPSLVIDRVDGSVVLAWVRGTATSLDIFVSRRNVAGSWTAPKLVAPGTGAAAEPAVQCGGKLIHLNWSEWAPGRHEPEFVRAALSRSLDVVIGPEPLDTDMPLLPPDGSKGDSAGADPSIGHLFLTALLAATGEEPGKVFVWGVRDEPVPVEFSVGFEMPSSATGGNDARAVWIGGKLVVSFVSNSGSFVHYTVHDGSWSDTRAVPLGDETTPAEARAQIRGMVERKQP